MILLMPEKTFTKRATKLVLFKDFLVADAMDDPDSEVSEAGNRIQCTELAPTTTLAKIALDPYCEQSRIRKKNINRYIENWINDDGFLLRFAYFADILANNYEKTDEDMNIFLVTRKEFYREYGSIILQHINELFRYDHFITLITHKMDKEQQRAIADMTHPPQAYRSIGKAAKKIRDSMDKKRVHEVYQEV